MDKASSKPRPKAPKLASNPSKSHSDLPGGSRDPPSDLKKSKSSSAPEKSATKPVRLHIAPLTAETAKAIIPTKHLADASFHAIDTFPERSYGFVTVPRSEADQLRRKYHGTFFRGVKMSVEEARPAKKIVTGQATDKAEKPKMKKALKPKPSEREDGVLPGFELPDGRHVKRGWTKDPQKGSKTGGKTIGTECLFKTVLPPTLASEFKDSLEDKSKKKSKSKMVKNQVIVKEFKNATKFPDFLKMNALPTDSSGKSTEFVEGLGWVNADGAVIDGVPAKRRRLSQDKMEIQQDVVEEKLNSEELDNEIGEGNAEERVDGSDDENNLESSEDSTSDSENTSSSDDTDEDSEDLSTESSEESMSGELEDDSSVASSDALPTSSSSDSSGDDSDLKRENKEKEGSTGTPSSSLRDTKQLSSNFANLTNIFKPKLSVDTNSTSQFKLFGGDLNDEDSQNGEEKEDTEDRSFADDSMLYTPVTPRTERIFRSGAPTPDTAVAPRFRDVIPFLEDVPLERKYFPTLEARSISAEDASKNSIRPDLLFPHSYNKRLHKLSIWSSLSLPTIFVTGEFGSRRSDAKDDSGKVEVQEQAPTDAVVIDEKPLKITPAKTAPATPALSNTRDLGATKTGIGSSIVGWSGKKHKFDDEDIDLPDALAIAPPKAKTGVGSGVAGWTGKKITFDEIDDDAGPASIDRTVLTGAKSKTGVGSGVSGWAGKKKTFADTDDENDNDEEEELVEHSPQRTHSTSNIMRQSQNGEESSVDQAALSITQAWEKAFYENRGDWNRQWKKKKRESAKAKRKKERKRTV